MKCWRPVKHARLCAHEFSRGGGGWSAGPQAAVSFRELATVYTSNVQEPRAGVLGRVMGEKNQFPELNRNQVWNEVGHVQ
jgi:hypothetical protein